MFLFSRGKLSNLKCFSLIYFNDSDICDKEIIPHLHRMINLEKIDFIFSHFLE
jgi:hypothetical protein